jgi:hypothetical protein
MFGMHWVLTIEREAPLEKRKRDASCNIAVALWCLSIQISSQTRREQFPLKGPIAIPTSSDGQPRIFNGREGVSCNVIGHCAPAVAMKFDSISLSLRSGRTESGTQIVSSVLPDGYGDFFGGYYDETWRGCAFIMLGESPQSDPRGP